MTFSKIAEFKNGATIQGFFLVKTAAIKTSTKADSQYGDYTLCDETGEINAKIWNVTEETKKVPQTGQIIKIQGVVSEFQNRLQLRIDRVRVATEEDPVDMGALVPSAPFAPAQMLNEIEKQVDKIASEELRELVKYLLDEHNEQLLVWPAALRNHHSVRSGLLYHTSTMLKMADAIAKVYPFLRKDLLVAGVVLHDLAKLEELSVSNTGLATDYTREGQLLGHITQGILMIERAAMELGITSGVITLLQHMLLSHHYEPEYGSPRYPMFAEAEALHYLDVLDARMYDFKKISEETNEGTFSERQWSLNNRQIYHIAETDLP